MDRRTEGGRVRRMVERVRAGEGAEVLVEVGDATARAARLLPWPGLRRAAETLGQRVGDYGRARLPADDTPIGAEPDAPERRPPDPPRGPRRKKPRTPAATKPSKPAGRRATSKKKPRTEPSPHARTSKRRRDDDDPS